MVAIHDEAERVVAVHDEVAGGVAADDKVERVVAAHDESNLYATFQFSLFSQILRFHKKIFV